jgi:hypothetical protein
MPLSPTDRAKNAPGSGPVALDAEPTCGSPGPTRLATTGITRGPGAANGWASDHDTGEGRRKTTGWVLWCLDDHNARKAA